MGDVVRTVTELEEIYGGFPEGGAVKVRPRVTPLQARYIEESTLAMLATVGPEGVDVSPRGDPAGEFVRVSPDGATLLMPDRRGNNRIDSLRNIVRDPRVALLFLVPGIGVTLRINGTARILTTPALRESLAHAGKVPATVIEITVAESYTQCPKALIRGRAWEPTSFRTPADLPTVGQIMNEITEGAFDGAAYDAAYPERVRQTIY